MRKLSRFAWEVDSTGGSALLMFLRVIFGGLMVAAAVSKLRNPLFFAQGLTAFDLIPLPLVTYTAFLVPWLELIAGSLVLAGLWTREAAAVLWGMLAGFTCALVHVLLAGKHIECGCFGDMFASLKVSLPALSPLFEALGDGAVSGKTIVRNLVFLGAFLALCLLGGGRWSLDGLFKSCRPDGSNAPESAAGQPA